VKAPDPRERPSLASARRLGWQAWLLQEWGLLVLAVVLTVIIWDVTSKQVIKPHTIEGVEVVLRLRPGDEDRIGAVLDEAPTLVDVSIRTSARRRDEVVEALHRDGRLVLELLVNPNVNAESRPINATDRWLWPFDDHETIDARAPLPTRTGRVFRLRGMRQGPILMPDTIPPRAQLEAEHGITVRMDLSQATYSDLLAPGSVLGEGLRPDPIDLTEILAQDALPEGNWPARLSFSQWREAPGDAPQRAYRRGLRLPEVTATLAFDRLVKKSIENKLVVLLDPDRYEWVTPEVARPAMTYLVFTGDLLGPKRAIERLEKSLEDWCWGVRVRPRSDRPLPEKPTDGGETDFTTVDAEVVFMRVGEAFEFAKVTFERKPGQDSFDLSVRRRDK
jgi:hypothetical protein